MKNSPNLDSFRNNPRNRLFLSVLIEKNADGTTPSTDQWNAAEIVIGGVFDGDVIGAFLNRILCGDPQRFSFSNLRPDDYADITEEFWTRYDSIGRCAFDPQHKVFYQNDDDRFTIVGDLRECHWCGAVHVRHVEERTEVRRIETWVEAQAA